MVNLKKLGLVLLPFLFIKSIFAEKSIILDDLSNFLTNLKNFLQNENVLVMLMYISILLGIFSFIKALLRFFFKNSNQFKQKEIGVIAFMISFISTSGLFFTYSFNPKAIIYLFGGYTGLIIIGALSVFIIKFAYDFGNGMKSKHDNNSLYYTILSGGVYLSTFILAQYLLFITVLLKGVNNLASESLYTKYVGELASTPLSSSLNKSLFYNLTLFFDKINYYSFVIFLIFLITWIFTVFKSKEGDEDLSPERKTELKYGKNLIKKIKDKIKLVDSIFKKINKINSNLYNKDRVNSLNELITIEENLKGIIEELKQNVNSVNKLSSEDILKINSLSERVKSFMNVSNNILLNASKDEKELINNFNEFIHIVELIIQELNSLNNFKIDNGEEIKEFDVGNKNLLTLFNKQNIIWNKIRSEIDSSKEFSVNGISNELSLYDNLEKINNFINTFNSINIKNDNIRLKYIYYLQQKLKHFSEDGILISDERMINSWLNLNYDFLKYILSKIPKKINVEKENDMIKKFDDILRVNRNFSSTNQSLINNIEEAYGKTFGSYNGYIQYLKDSLEIDTEKEAMIRIAESLKYYSNTNKIGNLLKMYLYILNESKSKVNKIIRGNIIKYYPGLIQEIGQKDISRFMQGLNMNDRKEFVVNFLNYIFNLDINTNDYFYFYKEAFEKYFSEKFNSTNKNYILNKIRLAKSSSELFDIFD